jgi:hypothetical protein
MKPVYDTAPGEFMKVIGTGPEGPKELPRLFDVVIEITMDKNTGVRAAHVDKDRTNALPKKFEFSYENLVKYFGAENLNRDAKILEKEETTREEVGGRHTKTVFGGKDIMTAGVTGDQLTAISEFTKDNQKNAMSMLANDFGVSSFLDLRSDEAALFIEELTKTRK